MKFYNENQELLADLPPREVVKIVSEELQQQKISKNYIAKHSGLTRKRVARIFNGGLGTILEFTKIVAVLEKTRETKK